MANLFIPKKYFKNSSNPFRQDFKTNKNEIFLSVNKKIVIIVCKFLKGTDLLPQRIQRHICSVYNLFSVVNHTEGSAWVRFWHKASSQDIRLA